MVKYLCQWKNIPLKLKDPGMVQDVVFKEREKGQSVWPVISQECGTDEDVEEGAVHAGFLDHDLDSKFSGKSSEGFKWRSHVQQYPLRRINSYSYVENRL